MNRRIRKKKEKQQQEMIENFAAALVELKEAIDAAEREYWRKWAEESTRQFAETIYASVNAATGERRNYSNRLHNHWLHDTRPYWKIHVSPPLQLNTAAPQDFTRRGDL